MITNVSGVFECADPPLNGTNTNPVTRGPGNAGDVYMYSCLSGYETADTNLLTTTCLSNGQWSRDTSPPACTGEYCLVKYINICHYFTLTSIQQLFL